VSELFGSLLCLTGKTKLVYSTKTQQGEFLEDILGNARGGFAGEIEKT
jgi:hypothetical protein